MPILNLDKDICAVIRARGVVRLALKGDNALRTFELHIAHTLNDDAKTTVLAGNEVLDPGELGERREWREFPLGDLVDFRPTGNQFELDGKFSSFADDYWQVYCSVDRT